MKRLLAILLCTVAVLSCSSPAFAADNAVEEPTSNEKYRVSAIPELRETNADTYLLSDGTYECVVYTEDKYYKDNDGELIEIDNSIVPSSFKSETASYDYANAANSTKVCFSDDCPGVYIDAGKYSLEFSLINSGDVQAATGAKANAYKFPDFNLQGENCITYTGAYENTDLVYSVNKGYVKETLFCRT